MLLGILIYIALSHLASELSCSSYFYSYISIHLYASTVSSLTTTALVLHLLLLLCCLDIYSRLQALTYCRLEPQHTYRSRYNSVSYASSGMLRLTTLFSDTLLRNHHCAIHIMLSAMLPSVTRFSHSLFTFL